MDDTKSNEALSRERRELLEQLLEQEGEAPPPPKLTIPRRETAGELPLSFAQQRLWFLDRLLEGVSAYNVPVGWRLLGGLDVGALEKSLGEIARRHGVLRTVFPEVGGQPVQIVNPFEGFGLEVVDLGGVQDEEREGELFRLAREEAWRPFDLGCGPVWRARLFRLSPGDHVLVVTMHHIVSDAWSLDVFLGELAELYGAFCDARPPRLAELPIQYSDYALWQREWLSGEVLKEQLGYWRGRLSPGVQVLDLPTDRPRPAVQSFRGGLELVVFPSEIWGALRELSRSEGVTAFMTLLAAFQVLLFRYTGQPDVVVGSPIAGRNRIETEGLIGFFVNTLVMRGDFSGDPTFRELLAGVREMALGAYAHQDLPFERLVEELQPERSLSHTPLFQVMVQLQTGSARRVEFPGLRLEPFRLGSGAAKFDLTLSMRAAGQRLSGALEYAAELFDAETIRRLLEHFEVLLRGIVADPDERVSRLPLQKEEEQHRVLEQWNRTEVPYPRDETVHGLFEAQVERAPESVAVDFEGEALTYEQLNERANQLAGHLKRLGVGPETLVGLCMERSLEMVVALLGILKAGGAYVPLDPTYPKERLSFMLEDTQTPVLLTQGRLLEKLPVTAARVVAIDRDRGAIAANRSENPDSSLSPQNLAYIIYTSGSTGQPKGVMVTHRAVIRLLFGTRYARLGAETVLLHLAPISFDASTFEIWGALLHGGRCVLFPERIPNPSDLAALIQSREVTTAWLTGSLFNTIIDTDAGSLFGLRQLLIGGEALSIAHVRRARELLPGTEIINGYGPTESTTFTCCHPIRPEDLQRNSIPIGRPIANTRVYLLDRQGYPVPQGISGELYTGGDGLARGYFARPGLTAERFVPDPFAGPGGGRLYRTGDVARYLPDGSLEFLGRTDHQVKIRGFRIEMEEVEAFLAQHPEVRQTVVMAEEGSDGERWLVAFAVPNRASTLPTAAELRSFLSERVPDYMLPAQFVLIEELPLTAGGKVDRRALRRKAALLEAPEKKSTTGADPVERRLLAIWESVLQVHGIQETDDFFALGGHSLLAVRLFTEIEKAFGQKLPLATLFQARTVAHLAAVIRQKGWQPLWSSLVPIQPKGSKPPFYCIHAVGGNVLTYQDLARHLGEDQPVYGLQAQGLDGKTPPHETLEEMAAHYIKEIRELDPEGPYHLGGTSSGGMVAYEIAQQMMAQGLRVGLLALFDTNGRGYPKLLPNRSRRYFRFLGVLDRIDLHLGNFMAADHRQKFRYIVVKAQRLKPRVRAYFRNKKRQQKEGAALPAELRTVGQVGLRALRAYVPRPYPGKITLFSATKQPSGIIPDPTLGWSQMALGGLDIYSVPGYHGAIVYEPRVGALAREIARCLEAANTEHAGGSAENERVERAATGS